MNVKKSLVGAIALWLCWPAPSEAQTGKMAIGLDYGASIIQQGSTSLFVVEQTGPGIVYLPYSPPALIPKNVRAHLEISLSSSAWLRFSAGYGYTKEKYNFESRSQAEDARLRNEAEFTAAGFPAEVALLLQLPLDHGKKTAVYFGAGGGFYSYTFKAEGLMETTGSFPSRSTSKAPDWKISGFAQFFVAGFGMRITSKLRANLEISKLGLSWLKETMKDEETISYPDEIITYKQTHEKDYAAASGFSDVALSLGIVMNLGK